MKKNAWKINAGINLAIGLFYWFLSSTNISLVGSIIELFLPFVIMLVALISKRWAVPADKKKEKILKLSRFPSIIAGVVNGVMILLMFVPPFTLGGLFMADELFSEKTVQKTESPNGNKIGRVYYRGIGAYDSGLGRVQISVGYKWLPLFEKDVYYNGRSNLREDAPEFFRWKDNKTIIAREHGEVRLGGIQFSFPRELYIPAAIFMIIVELIKSV